MSASQSRVRMSPQYLSGGGSLQALVAGKIPKTLVTGVVDALRALKAKRIVVGTPYLDEVNQSEAEFLVDKGFEVLEKQQIAELARVSEQRVLEMAAGLDQRLSKPFWPGLNFMILANSSAQKAVISAIV